MFNEERLNEMLEKDFNSMSENEKSVQVQVFQDMIRYKEYLILLYSSNQKRYKYKKLK